MPSPSCFDGRDVRAVPRTAHGARRFRARRAIQGARRENAADGRRGLAARRSGERVPLLVPLYGLGETGDERIANNDLVKMVERGLDAPPNPCT